MGLIKTYSAQFAKIKVIGIGGGGNNAVNSMMSDEIINGVDFITVNTDSQSLLNSLAPVKIQIGEKLTKGLGAGGNPQIGNKAAHESKEKIKEILSNTDMLFITGGMGGGTCTGAAPIIAKIAKEEMGILTIAIVTKPFLFEGTRRMTNAQEGINQLKPNVDTLIVIPNQKVMELVNDKATIIEAFKIADSVLTKGVKAIAELITNTGLINLDFADVKSVMSNAGSALIGVGEAGGDNRAQKAISFATESPLLEVQIDGARGILINITGGLDLTMSEIEQITQSITNKAAPDANIIFGANIDKNLKDKVKVAVIATGFQNMPPKFNYQKTTDQTTADNSNINIKSYINPNDLPSGLDIEDEFDIPAFLRNK